MFGLYLKCNAPVSTSLAIAHGGITRDTTIHIVQITKAHVAGANLQLER